MGNMRSSLDEVTNSNDKKNNTNNKCHRSRSPFYKLLKFNSRNKKIKNRQYKSNSTSRISNVDKLNSVQPTKPDYVLEKRETNNHDSKHDKNTDMYGYQHIENIKKSKCIHYSVKIGETKFNINHIYVGWCAEEILNDYYENLNTIDIDNIILNNFSIYSEKSNKQYIKKGFYVMSLNDIIFATSNNGNCDNDFVIENGIKITCIVDIYSGEIKFSFNNITVASDCEIPNKIRILPVIISTNTCLQQSITFYHIDVKQSTDICKYYNYLYAKNIKPIKNTWPRAVYAEILNTMNWKYVPLHFDDLNYTTLTTFSNSQKCHINDLAEYQQHYLELINFMC
ncbi:hypothetical protein A3Q56_07404 [Intoshia linei]|uniref:Uncharacterized protein n=1 Tax=Intoshia linei TaxID=1819745 RepID=A0A177AU49_9BILA|nr:hypothetical protein A3Q56_07404 [Intoshia linei]